jgi:hypothetical protein
MKVKMGRSIEEYIGVDIVITKEGNQYSSWCPNLDIASCGRRRGKGAGFQRKGYPGFAC